MTDDDWNMDAVRRYLKLHDDFQGLLMLLIFLFGGQVPRGTDLLAVEHCNSPSNRRGVYIYVGTIVIINNVNKARRATNREFYVVRVLPKEAAELFYAYLVYIRPLYCMLYRRCLHVDLDTSLLFFSATDPQKPLQDKSTHKITERIHYKSHWLPSWSSRVPSADDCDHQKTYKANQQTV
jgi:hypothetical protein